MAKGFPNMAKLAIAKKANTKKTITKKATIKKTSKKTIAKKATIKKTSKKTIAKNATLKKNIGEKAIAQNAKPGQKAQIKRTEEPTEIDIIGGLISNYSLTGENLARQILSYMDFRSIKNIRFVCKSWNKFLSEDLKLMLKIVRRAEPYLEDLCCKLSAESRPVSRKEKREKIYIMENNCQNSMNNDCYCCPKYFDWNGEPCGKDPGYGYRYDPEADPESDCALTIVVALTDGYMYYSDEHLPYCKCAKKRVEKVDPYSKFDRKIEGTTESSKWKEFFDYIKKKEEIGCKKIFQLGKKIHCIFAFAQKWHFAEEFKGYFIGQENFKEIRGEILKEIRNSSNGLNYFERSLYKRNLEFGIFVEHTYLGRQRMGRTNCTMKEMMKEIEEELNRFAEI